MGLDWDPNPNRKSGHNDQRLTTCKLCPRSVLKTDEWVWSTRNPIGMVHAECQKRQVRP